MHVHPSSEHLSCIGLVLSKLTREDHCQVALPQSHGSKDVSRMCVLEILPIPMPAYWTRIQHPTHHKGMGPSESNGCTGNMQ